MKRRGLLCGAALWPCTAAVRAASPTLPEVLMRPATVTPLAARSALLAATRAGQRLLVAGERGIVLTSDDGGQQWAQARVPVQVSLTSMVFANARDGWAGGHFGVLLRTTDGGLNWTLAMDGVRSAQVLMEGAADDAQRQSAQRRVEEGADKPFFDLALTEGGLIAVGAYGLALASRDGLAFEALGHRLPNPRQLHLYGVRADATRMFIVGEQGLLLRSTDGGKHFEALPPPYKGSFFGLLLLGDSTVLAYGLRGNLWRSADNGSSWTQVPNPLPVSISAGLQRADGSVVLLAQNGDLLLSRDQGQHIERLPASAPFPAATLAVAAQGQLLVAGLRGLRRQALA